MGGRGLLRFWGGQLRARWHMHLPTINDGGGAHVLIGLSGKKRAGKDTVAAYLVEKYGFTRVAFADPLREVALKVDPIIGAEVDPQGSAAYGYGGEVHDIATAEPVHLSDVVSQRGWEAAKDHCVYGPEVRRILQRMGVGVRDLDPDFWLRVAAEKIGVMMDARRNVVVTDVRFPNEADYIKRHGFLIRVIRPGLDHADTHESETALDDYPHDAYLINDGSVQDLRDQVDCLLGEPISV